MRKENKKSFVNVYDGGSDVWLWRRHIEGGRYHFIEVTDMNEACGRDNEGRPKYYTSLAEVDLDVIPTKSITDACRSWGLPPGQEHHVIAEMCHSYGCKAHLFESTSNNLGKSFREARKESYALTSDPEAMHERLNRTVNKLGSTAREYMIGDLTSAMVRGVRAQDPAATLVAKMHGATPELITSLIEAPEKAHVSFGFSAQLHDQDLLTLSKGDAIAYVYGFMQGFRRGDMEGERDELAQAYKDGFKHGIDVSLGHKEKPTWIK